MDPCGEAGSAFALTSWFVGEFWLGLKKIQSIGGRGDSRLRFLTEDWKQEKHSTEFGFILDGADYNYTIHLRAEDLTSDLEAMTGSRFSTKDNNDGVPSTEPNCSHDLTGMLNTPASHPRFSRAAFIWDLLRSAATVDKYPRIQCRMTPHRQWKNHGGPVVRFICALHRRYSRR